jgi:hypothetical protein
VTTYESYGFTKADPAAALAAANRLAEGHGQEAARRLHDDGSIDVAIMKEREFHLYLVSPGGTTALVESQPPPPGRRYWKALMWFGLAVMPIGVVAAMLRYPHGTDRESPPELMAVALALLAVFVGGVAAKRYDLHWHLSKQFSDPETWRPFREPSGWSPRSIAQLAAAERLAYHEGGKALVRELPDGTAEVVTEQFGRLSRHLIAESGAATELAGAGRTPLYNAATAMAVVGLPGAFGAFVVLGSTFGRFAALAGALAMMSLVPLGASLARKDELERRIQRSEPGTWYLLRTNAEPRGD